MSAVQFFNNSMDQFLAEMVAILPADENIALAKNAVLAARKANPKLLVKMWRQLVVGPYEDRIVAGDIQFFLDRDYTEDIQKLGDDSKLEKAIVIIQSIKDAIASLSCEQTRGAVAHIQRLTALSKLVC